MLCVGKMIRETLADFNRVRACRVVRDKDPDPIENSQSQSSIESKVCICEPEEVVSDVRDELYGAISPLSQIHVN